MKRRWIAVFVETDEDAARLFRALRVLRDHGTLDLPLIPTLDWELDWTEEEEHVRPSSF